MNKIDLKNISVLRYTILWESWNRLICKRISQKRVKRVDLIPKEDRPSFATFFLKRGSFVAKEDYEKSKEGRVAEEGHLVPKEGRLVSKEDRKFQKRVARFKRGSRSSKEGRLHVSKEDRKVS